MQTILNNAKRLYQLKLNQILPLYTRYIHNELLNSTAKITGIYGARGVGKTTILMQMLKKLDFEPSAKLYISWDYSIFKDIKLFDFVDEFSKRGGEVLVVDEIHEAKDFQEELKSIYDFLDVKVYFSSSSAVSITNPDFARRYSMYHLNNLSFREFLELTQNISLKKYTLEHILTNHENIVPTIFENLKEKKIFKYFDKFKDIGVYPYYFEDKTKYIDRINDTIDTILHKDLTKIFNIQPDKIDTLKKLLVTICVSKPLEISIDKLASRVGITKTTLYNYIHYLDKAELITHISHEAKRFKNIKKADKLYLNNTNLFNALCSDVESGTIREVFFVNMLKPFYSVYYSDIGDFIVGEKYIFEVGGKNKSYKQIKDVKNSFVVADDIEVGFDSKIPLWLFGFLY
jgi:predicted AAA+ superfamily ATPase